MTNLDVSSAKFDELYILMFGIWYNRLGFCTIADAGGFIRLPASILVFHCGVVACFYVFFFIIDVTSLAVKYKTEAK